MMVVGDVGALLLMVRLAVLTPVVVGRKRTWMVQVAFAATAAPHPLLRMVNRFALAPMNGVAGSVTVSCEPATPVLRIVSARFLPPPRPRNGRVVLPNSSGDGVTVIADASPLPDSATVCGLPAALSVTVSVPVAAPPAVGWKRTVMTQLAPAATVPPIAQPLLTRVKPAPVA